MFFLFALFVFIQCYAANEDGFSAFNRPLTSPARDFNAQNKPETTPAAPQTKTKNQKTKAAPKTKTRPASSPVSSSRFRRFPRFTLEELEKPENAEFAEGLLPFVITDVASRWDAVKRWNDVSYFENNVPQEICDWYPKNLMNRDDHPILTAINNAINNMRQNLNQPAYIQMRLTTHGRNMLFKDIDMSTFPELIKIDWWLNKHGCLITEEARDNFIRTTQWNMLLIGNKNAGMFMHPDGLDTGTYQAQLAGDKVWFLCSPDQAQFLYGPGIVDAFHPDLTRFPLFQHAQCIQDTVRAGELVYYPSNWWHQTLNMHFPTVGLAGRAVSKYNFRGVREHLQKKCKSKDPDLSLTYPGASPNPSPEVCKSIQKCYQLWRSHFGKPVSK